MGDRVEMWDNHQAALVVASSSSSICHRVHNMVSRIRLHSIHSIGMDKGHRDHMAHRGHGGRCHWGKGTQDKAQLV